MADSIFLTIAHNIYLSREERYKLNEPEAELSIIGITLPVWVRNSFTSEPADEVISKYVIKTHSTDPNVEMVSMSNDGFTIYLTRKEDIQSLRDRKDGGLASIYITYQTKINRNEQEVLVINYINIQDISALGEVPMKGNT